MKNLFITAILVFYFLSAYAQNDDYKMVGGLHAGYSLTGSFIKAIADSDPNANVEAKTIPAMQLTFDYGLSKLFSIGIAASYQTVSIDAREFSYTDDAGMSRTESFSSKFVRSQIAIRPLFHYANTDRLDLYSGFRVGLLNRGFKKFDVESDTDLDESVFADLEGSGFGSGTRFSFGVTAFGLRYYFTENIGAGLEINLGAPYITNVGVSARF